MIGPTWLLLACRMNAAAPADAGVAVAYSHPPHLGNARRPPVARSDDVAAGAVALFPVLVFSVVGLAAIPRGPRVPFVPAIAVRLPAGAEQIAEQAVPAVPRPERHPAIVVLP